jgi:hypothetical protein
MIITTHQPVFLPWPGFFSKAMHADCMVLLDGIQYPRGRSWVNRNRVKNENGTLWLTVPVWKKGRGFQSIRDVEICNERDWRRKHLRGIQQNYVNAPYFDEYFEVLASIYKQEHTRLMKLDLELVQAFWKALSLDTKLLLQSDLGIEGRGTDLIVKICNHLNADRLAIFPITEKYLDLAAMKRHGIEPLRIHFHPPVYPQLWGDFIYNLSILDLLLNCGPISRRVLLGAGA